MILKNLEEYKVTTTKKAITSFAGLPLLMEMARNLGLEKSLNELKLKERNRGYQPAETILTVMGMMQSGGRALNDVEVMKEDEGLKALMGEMPSSNTIGEWLRKFKTRTVYELGKIQLNTAVKVIEGCGMEQVTLDMDAFFLESQKSDVKMNYKGEMGYNPVALTCAETKMPMAGIFRAGNESAMKDLSGLLKRVLTALPEEKIKKIKLRSDSAGYQVKLIKVCHENKGRVDFTITARKDAGVRETIRSIPEDVWKKYEGGAWENREQEIAETVHAFGEGDLPSYRLIVVRWVKEERDLFDKDKYEYHAVITSMNDWTAGLVLQFHRTRQDASENVNKELSGGFGLSKLPCREIMANAAYFQIALLANTVFAALKHLALPESWRPLTIKTVRYRLIRLAGIVAERSRYLWLKISEKYQFRKIYEDALWRIRGLSIELRFE